jgi:hypothetical protein
MNKKIYISIILTLSLFNFSTASFAAIDSVVQDMQKAATAFLDSLTTEMKVRATFPMDIDGERTNWHFVPKTGERKGVDLKDLNETQEAKLHALLAASLSAQGQKKVKNIQSLENVLYILENKDHRDPELYYTSIFGNPSKENTWGWRIEGHHLSLNFTVVEGKLLSNSPNFWGANPAKVPVGPTTGFRALKEEEDLARAFVLSLNDKQREIAIIEDIAPKDVYTSANVEVSPLSPNGIKISQLEKAQRKGVEKIIDEYLGNMPADVASDRWEKLKTAGLDNISFAWAGSTDVGEPHYYRVQGPTFLIEYDNVQNKANHIHAVWRDFDGDFGRDILREHHAHSH